MSNIACNAQSVKHVRSIFAKSGIPIAEWARAEGFSTALVYQVIEGNRKCMRGQSHQIAVALGLKEGVIGDISQLRSRLAAFAAKTHPQAERRSAGEDQSGAPEALQPSVSPTLPSSPSLQNFGDGGHGFV